MNDDEWEFPAPMEDPEGRQTRLVRDDDGGARLVPGGNVVEGETSGDDAKAAPSCPFSGR